MMRGAIFRFWPIGLLCAAALVSCAPPTPKTSSPPPARSVQSAPIVPAQTEAASGVYTLDKSHASLLFRVNHMGFSHYTGRFSKFDATLNFDPASPEKSTLSATVDATSLALENPPPGFVKELLGPNWLDARRQPKWTFTSTKVTLTSPNSAKVDGDFAMRGVTHPLTLDVTFNGGYRGHPLDPHARAGFSGRGVLKRSDYGVTYGIPAPGTTMGVSDEVDIIFEGEFSGPPLPPDAAKTGQ